MPKRRWLVRGALALAGLVLIAGGVAVAYALYVRQEGEDVRGSSTVEFVPDEAAEPPQRSPETNPIAWPAFGFGPTRQHVAPAGTLRPPFRRLWVAGGSSLLEFPPVIGYGRLYVSNGAGAVRALGAKTGRQAWVYRGRRCGAASPALGPFRGGTVYQTFLGRLPCTPKSRDGEIVALRVGNGKVRWKRRLGPSETSPLVADDRVFVGDWHGDVYALSAATGRTEWRFRAGGEVKGGVALAGGRVFLGAYDGHVYALRGRDGRLLWRASADPRLFGHGRFYSTPAIAYGRLYIGSTDGKVYSFGATTGRRLWSQSTGGYVYGSPAIWRKRVFVGSYDETFYALDAATGDIVWRFRANGPISGSATVVDGIVYFSTLRGRTYGLDARTGRLRWTFPDGKYAAVVAEGRRLYLTGYARIYAFASAAGS